LPSTRTSPTPETVAVEIVVAPPEAEPPVLPVVPELPLPLVVESFPQAARSSIAATTIGPIHATRLFVIVPPEG
jgi:hypothetical protein